MKKNRKQFLIKQIRDIFFWNIFSGKKFQEKIVLKKIPIIFFSPYAITIMEKIKNNVKILILKNIFPRGSHFPEIQKLLQ